MRTHCIRALSPLWFLIRGPEEFRSSTGFAVLLKLVKQAKDQGSNLKFCNLDPDVCIGADIIGLDKVASLYGTEHEAIKAFAEE